MHDARRRLGATRSSSLRTATSLLLAGLLALTAGSGAALAAQKEKAGDEKPEEPPAQVEQVKGAKYRMAKARMAKQVTRFADEAEDQQRADGSRVAEAPAWSDISAVYVSSTRTPAKLLTKMAKDFPPGVPGAFYGPQADWQKGDPAVFVAVEMAERLPDGVGGQQVEVGLGGDRAQPMQVGSALDARAGVQRFSLSGDFGDGILRTGTTDISGREPGGAIEYYNTDSRVFGYYDAKRATWYLIMPRSTEEDSVRVSVRSSTPGGQVIDHLERAGGGRFVDLEDPAGGWGRKSGIPPLACRGLETFSPGSVVELGDPDATRIRYTAGMEASAAPDVVAAALGPAIEAAGPVPVALTAVGSEDDPVLVDGELSVAPGLNAVSLTFEAPPGQWRFGLADDLELVTPAGERIIDHASLTGVAGVRTGPGLDGLVAGDLSCVVDEPWPAEVAEASEADPAEADAAVEGG